MNYPHFTLAPSFKKPRPEKAPKNGLANIFSEDIIPKASSIKMYRLLLLSFAFAHLTLAVEVNTTRDEDNGPDSLNSARSISLREAILYSSPGETITFHPSLDGRTLLLSGSQLTISKNLVIDASSLTNGLTIDANTSATDRRRVLGIESNTTATLLNLTLTGGWEADGASGPSGEVGENGGGIFLAADASLTLVDCSVIENQSGNGGDGSGFDGNTSGADDGGHGGGIYVSRQGILTLSSCTVARNRSGDGGNSTASYNLGGKGGNGGDGGGLYFQRDSVVNIVSTSIVDNFTGNGGDGGRGRDILAGFGGNGGGIYSFGTTLHIASSMISGNKTGDGGDPVSSVGYGGDGGGMAFNSGSEVTLNTCTIDDNRTGKGASNDGEINQFSSRDGNGGGILLSSSSRLTLTASTISNNQTGDGRDFDAGSNGFGGNGGGIAAESSAELVLSNCTVSGNRTSFDKDASSDATVQGGVGGAGGGIYFSSRFFTLSLASCTIANNFSSNSGGGVFAFPDLSLDNTIIGNNEAVNTNCSNVHLFNPPTFIQTSIIGDASLAANTPGLIIADPLLSPLGNYGGSTQTLLPLPGSPAIDTASISFRNFDQRGVRRNLDGDNDGTAMPDIGAVEAPNWANPSATQLAFIFHTDFDGDGSVYGQETLLGSDPFNADPNHPGNIAPIATGRGVTFGRTQSFDYPYQVDLYRSFDLSPLSFTKVYSYSSVDHTQTSSHSDLTPDLTNPGLITLPDSTTESAAFYQLRFSNN